MVILIGTMGGSRTPNRVKAGYNVRKARRASNTIRFVIVALTIVIVANVTHGRNRSKRNARLGVTRRVLHGNPPRDFRAPFSGVDAASRA